MQALAKLQQQGQFQQQQNVEQQKLAQPGQLLQQKAKIEADTQQRELEQAQNIVEQQAGKGRAVNAKVGGVDVSQKEENPLKYLFKSQQQGAHALQHAYDTYSKGLPDLNKAAGASVEGLQAVSDPTQIGSLGIVRSQMLRSMGMNRYNDQEASKSMPPALYQYAKGLFMGADNWSGSDPDKGDNNPMNANQKQAAESFFRGNLQNVKERHGLLRQTALGSYQNSGFYDPAQAEGFKNSVGKDFDGYLDKNLAPKPGTPPSNYQSPIPGAEKQQPAQQPQQQSGLSGFFSKLNPFSSSQPQPQSTPMSFEDFKKSRQQGPVQ